jgi:hypothetical protein
VEGGLQPDWDESASYVRDVGRLTEADIAALKVLQEHRTKAWLNCAHLGRDYLENLFIHCFRLAGYGLAFSEDIGIATRHGVPLGAENDGVDWKSLPSPQAFRLSARGQRLLAMLSFGAPLQSAA